jgi:hypothetical protein
MAKALAASLSLALPLGLASSAEAKEDASGGISSGLVLLHFMLDDSDPGLIIPCVRVQRRLLGDSSLFVEITATYTSRGEVVTREFEVPLDAFSLTDHHPQPAGHGWRLLDAYLDISDAPIDDGSDISGSAELVRRHADA